MQGGAAALSPAPAPAPSSGGHGASATAARPSSSQPAEIHAGKVCKLGQPKPFGFIAPAEGGPNLYFNEAQLGHEVSSWAEFCDGVSKYDDSAAPVFFRVETSRDGKLQAVGVVLLDGAPELADADGTITDAKLQAYLAEHPELAERSLTKWEMRKRQQQADWEARQAANATKHQEWEARQAANATKQEEWEARQAAKAAKHKEWEARQAANAAKHAEWEARQAQHAREHRQREEAYRARKQKDEQDNTKRTELKQRHDAAEEALRARYDACWERIHTLQTEREQLPQGSTDESSNRIKAEIEALHNEKNALRVEEVALDHKHDIEMFEYVQENEHDGRVRDGSWVDLHGSEMDYVTEHIFPRFLLEAIGKHRVVQIITGAGNHSEGGISVVKQWVWSGADSLLNRAARGEVAGLEGLEYSSEEGNAGSVLVDLSGCTGGR